MGFQPSATTPEGVNVINSFSSKGKSSSNFSNSRQPFLIKILQVNVGNGVVVGKVVNGKENEVYHFSLNENTINFALSAPLNSEEEAEGALKHRAYRIDEHLAAFAKANPYAFVDNATWKQKETIQDGVTTKYYECSGIHIQKDFVPEKALHGFVIPFAFNPYDGQNKKIDFFSIWEKGHGIVLRNEQEWNEKFEVLMEEFNETADKNEHARALLSEANKTEDVVAKKAIEWPRRMGFRFYCFKRGGNVEVKDYKTGEMTSKPSYILVSRPAPYFVSPKETNSKGEVVKEASSIRSDWVSDQATHFLEWCVNTHSDEWRENHPGEIFDLAAGHVPPDDLVLTLEPCYVYYALENSYNMINTPKKNPEKMSPLERLCKEETKSDIYDEPKDYYVGNSRGAKGFLVIQNNKYEPTLNKVLERNSAKRVFLESIQYDLAKYLGCAENPDAKVIIPDELMTEAQLKAKSGQHNESGATDLIDEDGLL